MVKQRNTLGHTGKVLGPRSTIIKRQPGQLEQTDWRGGGKEAGHSLDIILPALIGNCWRQSETETWRYRIVGVSHEWNQEKWFVVHHEVAVVQTSQDTQDTQVEQDGQDGQDGQDEKSPGQQMDTHTEGSGSTKLLYKESRFPFSGQPFQS